MNRKSRRRLVAATSGLLVLLFAPAVSAADPTTASQRRQMTEAEIVERALPVPRDSLDRRERSQARLESEGIPFNRYLPAIEGESEARRRGLEEVAERAMALLIVASRAEGMEREQAQALVTDYALANALSPVERDFLAGDASDETQRIQLFWRYEAAWTLLWALGYVDRLDKPERPADPREAVRILADRSRAEFLAGARLRPLGEILDQADLIYRYHWAARDAQVNNRPLPPGLDYDVIMERHYALNWLIGYMDQPWDEVSTDT